MLASYGNPDHGHGLGTARYGRSGWFRSFVIDAEAPQRYFDQPFRANFSRFDRFRLFPVHPSHTTLSAMGQTTSTAAQPPASCPVKHDAAPAKCPVPHTAASTSTAAPAKCPIEHTPAPASPPAQCPIKHEGAEINPLNNMPTLSQNQAANQAMALPTQREESSIPRDESSRWEYPSPQQFYNALVRKGWETPEEHVETMVQIHNFLNEQAWQEILKWEKKENPYVTYTLP